MPSDFQNEHHYRKEAPSGVSKPMHLRDMKMQMKAAPGFQFRSGKTYTHAHGLSCAFRQWRADSHCNKLHGYSLQVELEFSATDLDHRNWVVDFGGLKVIKHWLEETFDHKTLAAEDDPQISIFRELHVAKVIDLVVVPNVGCEAFAQQIFYAVHGLIELNFPHAQLERVTVREHGGNHASYERLPYTGVIHK